ncbi:hypothetical protein TNCV_2398881 [Trichonephila clavipes]|uniref:Uncharacterized protein n=1 Tax=Trichonephila clavipes TaxID=2585209 RepID=A0A8X6T4V0_TRICX|nr:hypothetical protein TNCV_2398881 [Trichonephila clavipes]
MLIKDINPLVAFCISELSAHFQEERVSKILRTSLIHPVALNITIKTLEITMKAYFFVMMALCIVLLAVQSVEMAATRERRQSSNNSTLNVGDLAVEILKEIFEGISLRNLLGK